MELLMITRKLLASAALLAMAGLAQAGSVVIDDFSANQGPLNDTSADGVAVTSTLGNRTISTNMLSGTAPIQNSVEVTAGVLDITNGTGDDSEVIVSWLIAAGLVPAGSVNVNFSALIVGSDANPTGVEFLLGSTSLLSSAIPGNTANQTISFSIDPALIAAGGTLTMKLNGAPGWDLTMDSFGITFDTPTTPTVPEPATLGLLGLAMLGAAGARRRKSR
jgi:hypothetical protein